MKTTREAAREEAHKTLVQNLQELLAKNYDAEKGFKKGIKESKNPDLKEYLKTQALRHHRFATELDKIIHSLNEKPVEEGSAVGKFHRVWIDVMLTISGNDDKTILEESIRGEKANLKEYDEKLKKHKFPSEIDAVLLKHQQELRTTLEQVGKPEDIL